MKKALFFSLIEGALFILLLTYKSSAQNVAPFWSLSGNNNATPTSILGNTNAVPLRLFTKNLVRMTIDTFGFVGIGTKTPVSTLDVRGTQFLNGVLKFGTGAHGLQFANPTTTANKAMMYMFTSGTTNLARMVIAHSTTYPNYGLQYNDTTDNFHFLSNGVPVFSVDLLNQAVKISSRLYLGGDVYQGINRIIHVDPVNYNTAVGINAGGNPGGSYNTSIGNNALTSNNNGQFNCATGVYSLNFNLSGSFNVANGYSALAYNSSGGGNIAIGYAALLNNSSGNNNSSVGYFSTYNNTTGFNNAAFGEITLYNNTTGSNNTALGNASMYYNTTASYNTAIGDVSLYYNTTGSENTAIGYYALFNNATASQNTALGAHALENNTAGAFNTASGYQALFNNTASYNTANGYLSLKSNTTGYSNTAIGLYSLVNNTTGNENTGIGLDALYYNDVGNNNTAIGFSAGDYVTNPNQGTFLGSHAAAGANLTNMTAIGYNANVDASNKVVVGNTSVNSIGGYANWTNFSDGRYKKNIREDVPGLEFINQLRAVTYTIDVDGIEKTIASIQKNRTHDDQPMIAKTLNTSSTQNVAAPRIKQPDLSELDRTSRQEKAKIKYTGFVAQEVEKAAQKLGYDFSGVDAPKSKDGFYGLRYGDFVVPLVKAVQELSKKTDEIEELKKQVQELKDLILGKKGINTLATMNLQQNTPNPAGNFTRIQYSIPSGTSSAQLILSDNLGRIVKSIPLNSTGAVNLDTSLLSNGVYTYSLIVDGKIVDTKKMNVIKGQ